MKILCVTSRSCSVLLDPEGLYEAREKRTLLLDGEEQGEEYRSVTSLFDLEPDTEYTLESRTDSGAEERITFRTKPETCTLNVRDFGAKGDGETEDTAKLQAAILCCPEGGRVLVPPGDYVTGPLFLKSHMTLELPEGAALRLLTDRADYPILPGNTPADNPAGEILLGMFEGCATDGFASALTGIGLEDVAVIGEGVVDGRADRSDWWIQPKEIRTASRGNLLYTQRCKGMLIQGITFMNSPSWNLHPAFSEDLDFIDIRVKAPWDSPNTDGFDPESCRRVRLLGAEISVGDDCIAIKSGKIGLGRKYKTPCEDLEIGWCAMLDGHGGVTVGSEMAGGVKKVRAHHCYMKGNDRALRVKTRRDRGRDGVVDDIVFQDIRMDGVKMPLVVNSFYFCDADGKTDRVQSREKQPVDETTPEIGTVRFERVKADGCKACVAYALGLPEKPMEHLELRDCAFTFDPEAKPMVPAMALGVEECARRGIIAKFIRKLTVRNISVEGMEGGLLDTQDVGEISES